VRGATGSTAGVERSCHRPACRENLSIQAWQLPDRCQDPGHQRWDEPVDLTPYYQFTRHGEAPRGSSFFLPTYTGPAFYTDANKFQKVAFTDIQEGKADFDKTADNGWVGMVQHHFVSAWLPEGNVKREYYTRSLGDGLYSAGVILAEGTPPRPAKNLTFRCTRAAEPVGARKGRPRAGSGARLWLADAAGVSDFLVAGKDRTHRRQLGWAIIILTILIKLALYPLSAAGYKSMAKMKKLTPRLQQLKETYGDDRAKLHQAMAEMYKTEKINPLGGCLPILIQIPVFIALYWCCWRRWKCAAHPGWAGSPT